MRMVHLGREKNRIDIAFTRPDIAIQATKTHADKNPLTRDIKDREVIKKKPVIVTREQKPPEWQPGYLREAKQLGLKGIGAPDHKLALRSSIQSYSSWKENVGVREDGYRDGKVGMVMEQPLTRNPFDKKNQLFDPKQLLKKNTLFKRNNFGENGFSQDNRKGNSFENNINSSMRRRSKTEKFPLKIFEDEKIKNFSSKNGQKKIYNSQKQNLANSNGLEDKNFFEASFSKSLYKRRSSGLALEKFNSTPTQNFSQDFKRAKKGKPPVPKGYFSNMHSLNPGFIRTATRSSRRVTKPENSFEQSFNSRPRESNYKQEENFEHERKRYPVRAVQKDLMLMPWNRQTGQFIQHNPRSYRRMESGEAEFQSNKRNSLRGSSNSRRYMPPERFNEQVLPGRVQIFNIAIPSYRNVINSVGYYGMIEKYV